MCDPSHCRFDETVKCAADPRGPRIKLAAASAGACRVDAASRAPAFASHPPAVALHCVRATLPPHARRTDAPAGNETPMTPATLYFDVVSPFAYLLDAMLRRTDLPLALERKPALLAGLL